MDDAHDALTVRRRRARFRAWHRGIREMDLIMGSFADARLADLDEAGVTTFEALLEAQDRDVFSWLSGEAPVPANYDTAVFRAVRAFHTHAGPVHR